MTGYHDMHSYLREVKEYPFLCSTAKFVKGEDMPQRILIDWLFIDRPLIGPFKIILLDREVSDYHFI